MVGGRPDRLFLLRLPGTLKEPNQTKKRFFRLSDGIPECLNFYIKIKVFRDNPNSEYVFGATGARQTGK